MKKKPSRITHLYTRRKATTMNETITESGEKSPHTSTHIHVYDTTVVATKVVISTPMLQLGPGWEGVNIYFNEESLDRVIMALTVMRETINGRAAIGTDKCPVHGSTCRAVWHKSEAIPASPVK